MKKIIMFMLIVATLGSALADEVTTQMTKTLNKVVESSHRYSVTLAYIPNVTEGASEPAAVYDAAVFNFRLQALAWQQAIESLAEILAEAKLLPSSDAGRWAAGVRIEDRTNSAVVFCVEISVPIHVLSINGKTYKAHPALIEWFRLELLPAVRTLNKGPSIRDL